MSRLAVWPGNGPGRSPASKAPLGGATMRSVASSEACGVVNVARLRVGTGGAEPGSMGARDRSRAWKRSREGLPPAYGARTASMVAAGTWETLPGPVACGRALCAVPPERGAL